MHTPRDQAAQEARFRQIFRRLHAGHAACRGDEWLTRPCVGPGGEPVRPVVWSRRNGPWRRGEVLWVGAAPGNAGGKGSGLLGAHATRIPFGGDVAGANLDVLLGSIGLTRNETFITAALNQLPEAGGGEPTAAELAARAGDFPSSLHALRDTLLAVGPELVIALGNVALRATLAAPGLGGDEAPGSDEHRARLFPAGRLERAGLRRGHLAVWPEAAPATAAFRRAWQASRHDAALPRLLWLTHPSAQNMSPYAGVETRFHSRMLEARDALRAAVRQALGWTPPARRAGPETPARGIYALPEWRERIGPRHAELDHLWRARGV